MQEKKFYTARNDRIFKAIFLSKNSEPIMKKMLESILETEIDILDYPRCDLPVIKSREKVTTVDFLIYAKNECIHLEVETGLGKEVRAKNFSGFTKIYNKNHIRGEKYDIETKFLHIDLQYGLGQRKNVIERYQIMNEERIERYVDNFEIIVVNMDKVVEFWYDRNEEQIQKYQYLIMLDLPEEELRKLGRRDKVVEEFTNKISDLNNLDRFQSDMSMEEKERLVYNTKIYYAQKESKMEMAKELFDMKMPVEDILKVTKLPREEIENLKMKQESN